MRSQSRGWRRESSGGEERKRSRCGCRRGEEVEDDDGAAAATREVEAATVPVVRLLPRSSPLLFSARLLSTASFFTYDKKMGM